MAAIEYIFPQVQAKAETGRIMELSYLCHEVTGFYVLMDKDFYSKLYL